MSLREGTGTSRSAAQQWHAARGMQNLAKQPKDDHATSLGQNRSAPCIRGRQCAPRRSGAAIRQHRGGIPLGSRSKCGVRPRAASAMVPRGGHRLNEPVVGEVGGRGGGGPDPLHPETPPFSKRVFPSNAIIFACGITVSSLLTCFLCFSKQQHKCWTCRWRR